MKSRKPWPITVPITKLVRIATISVSVADGNRPTIASPKAEREARRRSATLFTWIPGARPVPVPAATPKRVKSTMAAAMPSGSTMCLVRYGDVLGPLTGSVRSVRGSLQGPSSGFGWHDATTAPTSAPRSFDDYKITATDLACHFSRKRDAPAPADKEIPSKATGGTPGETCGWAPPSVGDDRQRAAVREEPDRPAHPVPAPMNPRTSGP